MTTIELLTEMLAGATESGTRNVDIATDLAAELEARGLAIMPMPTVDPVDVRTELATLFTDTEAELERAVTALGVGSKAHASPEGLNRMALLSERLNVLDEVQRIVGS